ncbi:MAG: hypothetical protein GY844_29605 [Bradyrhizobium sp.]|jgi:hypothetical protein|nr:hypothetical protein [Bradyrhizobium sp.]
MMAYISFAVLWLTARQLRIAHLRDRARERECSRWTRIEAYAPYALEEGS